MNRVSAWQDFNACQFIVSFCLLIFSILFACREQLLIHWPYWFIFLPLFLWKSLAIVGAIIGICTYCCTRSRNHQRNSPILCRALFFNLIETVLLLIFEILVCYNLDQSPDSHHRLTWIICFLPLIILSVISVFTYIWLLRHGRSWEIQALFVISILQFIFFALKLDNSIITWNYGAVFIPLWIVMGISIIFCIARLVWTLVHYRHNEINHVFHETHRPGRRYCYILASPVVGHIYVLLFLLIFQVLLVIYLEHMFDLSFIVVSLPLYIALVILIFMSFSSRVPANQWWFGLRQDACEWLLHICPIFETYVNVEYNFRITRSPVISLHNVNLIPSNSPIRPTLQSNGTNETSYHHAEDVRSFFRRNSRSFGDQTKNAPLQNELLTALLLPVSNILRLYEPD